MSSLWINLTFKLTRRDVRTGISANNKQKKNNWQFPFLRHIWNFNGDLIQED